MRRTSCAPGRSGGISRRAALLLWAPLAARGADAKLVFSHKIGTDWTDEGGRWMNFVALRADGRMAASNGKVPGGEPGGTGLWGFPDGEFARRVEGEPLAMAADFRYLATGSGVRQVETGRAIFEAPAGSRFTQAAFSQGELAALGAGRAAIRVVRLTDGSVAASFGDRYTGALAFHPQGDVLASGHWNHARLWNARTGEELGRLVYDKAREPAPGYRRDGRYLCGLGFNHDGTLLAAGSDDGELQIWNVPARRLAKVVNIGSGFVSNPAFGPDGRLVAAGTYADGMLTLADARAGRILSQVQVSMFGVGAVAFSADGGHVVAPSNGGEIGRRKFESGGSIRVYRVAG